MILIFIFFVCLLLTDTIIRQGQFLKAFTVRPVGGRGNDPTASHASHGCVSHNRAIVLLNSLEAMTGTHKGKGEDSDPPEHYEQLEKWGDSYPNYLNMLLSQGWDRQTAIYFLWNIYMDWKNVSESKKG